ncbi:hypothetical protein GS636_21505 [Ruegeria sp. HKCCD4884]|uniref:hypothetical protein n=1 Tax=Ruegeria sp. HKCCD4884 TaxID=2683022 RepID=UPI0014911E10|nr:hypothetical protein [Ruegeria sp. HKCCD4884]NOD95383.1 hypothetical protein [Ruegeria sp. HKCCD4884]
MKPLSPMELKKKTRQMAAVEEFEEALDRTGNLHPLKQEAATVGALMSMLSKMFPAGVHGSRLNAVYSMAEAMLDNAAQKNFVGFGGEAAAASDTTPEFRNIKLVAAAVALQERVPSITKTDAQRRVSHWSNGAVSTSTLQRWWPGGEQCDPWRKEQIEFLAEKAKEMLDGMSEADAELCVKDNVKQLVSRLAKLRKNILRKTQNSRK